MSLNFTKAHYSAFPWNGRKGVLWSAAGLHSSFCVALLPPSRCSPHLAAVWLTSPEPQPVLTSHSSLCALSALLTFLGCSHASGLESCPATCQYHVPSLILQLSL